MIQLFSCPNRIGFPQFNILLFLFQIFRRILMPQHLHDSIRICDISVAIPQQLHAMASPAVFVAMVLTPVVFNWIWSNRFGDMRQHGQIAASNVLNSRGVTEPDIFHRSAWNKTASRHQFFAVRSSNVVNATRSKPSDPIKRAGNVVLPVFR